ncbi:hypothetical protein GA0074695_6079 [Micromonospora viridifaciens]|uniref:Abi-like protein n=1 Tax=Micromonospora viridifaciens TaxID=1881 RepID=A0A1C4ZTN4_MICVI|nr:hypothetical protein [Micromonospora viridifaciens]SCF36144.1 hypothetical protein GA0074695_6079 [Micromonospora viridifaciens]
MSDDLPEWMRRFFSDPRLEPYLQAAKRNALLAESLYWWNIKVSQAFYLPLGRLEVAVRNALHDQLQARYQRTDWWVAAPLRESSIRLIQQARDKCQRRGSGLPSTDDIVAQLSFGFWVALISTGYDRGLWVPTLHKAFPRYSGRRAELHRNLDTMRLLRNRIGHQEPIHHRDLATDHSKIYRLLNYLSPELAAGVRLRDEVPAVLAERPVLP